MASDKTVIITDCPISDRGNKVVTQYEFQGSPQAFRRLSIVASSEVGIPALLAHLQAILDSEVREPAPNIRSDMERA